MSKAKQDLDEWLADPKNKKAIREYVTTIWYWSEQVEKLVEEQYKQMLGWLIANPERGKKRYKRFVCNWLRKFIQQHTAPRGMTNDQEQKHYKEKRR